MLTSILPDTGKWELVNEKINVATAITAGNDGTALVQENTGLAERLDITGKQIETVKLTASAMAYQVDGSLNYLTPSGGLFKVNAKGARATVLKAINGANLITTDKGYTYITCPTVSAKDNGRLLLLKPGSKPMVVDSGLRFASAIIISPDKSLLLVAEDNTNWIYSYVIQPDGTLKYKQHWYWLHQTDGYGYSKVSDMAMDDQGNLYAATNMGVQVCDQNGRVRAILQLPYGAVTGLCFAGKNFDNLLVICGGRVYKRRLKVKGVPAWAAPVHLKSIGAG